MTLKSRSKASQIYNVVFVIFFIKESDILNSVLHDFAVCAVQAARQKATTSMRLLESVSLSYS